MGLGRINWSRRMIVGILVACSVGLAVAVFFVSLASPGMFAPDANTYLAAGERLNAAHRLYALSSGDRPIDMNPPYWTVPFLSPPFLGVIWRPIALIGDAARLLWWAGSLACLLAGVGLFIRRAPARTAMTLVVLSVPLALSAKFANVNGMLLLAAIGVWWLWVQDRVELATFSAILMTGIKLTPAPLVLWLLFLKPRRSIPAALGGAALVFGVSVVGSSLGDVTDYVDVILHTVGPGTTDLSLPGIARSLGLGAAAASAVLPIAWFAAAVALYLARGVPSRGYRIAIVTWVLVSPVVHTIP